MSLDPQLRAEIQRLLAREDFDPSLSFYSNGGDSIQFVLFTGAATDILGYAPADDAFDPDKPIDWMLRRLSSPGPQPTPLSASRPPEGEGASLPPTANRWSLLSRIRPQDQGKWIFSSSVFAFDGPFVEAAFQEAVTHLQLRHDSLRLRLCFLGATIEQTLGPPSEAIIRHTGLEAASPGYTAVLAGLITEIRDASDLDRPLFHVVATTGRFDGFHVLLVYHHAVADAASLQIMINDLGMLYRRATAPSNDSALSPAPSYAVFCREHEDYMAANAMRDFDFWQEQAWDRIRPIPVHKNFNRSTRDESFMREIAVPLGAPHGGAAKLQGLIGSRGVTMAALASIASAYGDWTGHDHLHLALVHHGRNALARYRGVERLVGWLSDIVPMLLPTRTSGGLDPEQWVGTQLRAADTKGGSYNFLRYRARQPLADHPAPQISINIKLGSAGKPASGDPAPVPCVSWSALNPPRGTRLLPITGGLVWRGGELVLAWEYDSEILDESVMKAFAQQCQAGFTDMTR